MYIESRIGKEALTRCKDVLKSDLQEDLKIELIYCLLHETIEEQKVVPVQPVTIPQTYPSGGWWGIYPPNRLKDTEITCTDTETEFVPK